MSQRIRFASYTVRVSSDRWAFLLLLLGTACEGAGSANGGADDAGSPSAAASATPPAGSAKGCADLYDARSLPRFEVEIADEEWAGMQSDCQATVQRYRPITFRYEGESQAAMMRLKGNWSWNCDKMQFLISFNEVDPDARFHGLRKIVLDAPWYDPTLLHERLAFHYLGQLDIPSSCVNHAELFVNGNYYGLYANVERVDREYLERHFSDPSGNLFKEGRELVTNEDEGNTAAVDAFWNAETLPEVESAVDLAQAVKVWAAEAMLPDPDSYWAGVEINFYLYEPPGERLVFLPYDADIAFAENLWPEASTMDPITHEHPEWLKESQFQIVLGDAAWCERFVAALHEARAAFRPDELEGRIVEWAQQIATALAEDPNRTFSMEEHGEAVAVMRTFPVRRAEFVDAWLAESHCPARWAASEGRR